VLLDAEQRPPLPVQGMELLEAWSSRTGHAIFDPTSSRVSHAQWSPPVRQAFPTFAVHFD
jgi:hypothetical protein